MKKIIIIGASGHGKVVADLAVKNGYKEIAFLDDNLNLKKCLTYPVLGEVKNAEKYREYDFIVAIGHAQTRKEIQIHLGNLKLKVVKLVHPDAVIAPDVTIGVGTVVMAGTVVNPGARIGIGCIINTGSTIDHDDQIDDFAHISIGCHVAGTVFVGKNVCLGAGAVVCNNLRIVDGCIIGAGAVVTNDILEMGTYVGVPARKVRG